MGLAEGFIGVGLRDLIRGNFAASVQDPADLLHVLCIFTLALV